MNTNKYDKMTSDFAEKMRAKMIQNDHKTGWKEEPVEWLLARLVEEVNELSQAVAYDVGVDFVTQEAADVANFAMMIADNYKEKKTNG